MSPSTQEILRFIEEVELSDNPLLGLGAYSSASLSGGLPQDSDSGSYVNGGSTQAFTDGLPANSKQDALLWTLFAQLAADKQYNRVSDVAEWYKYYSEVLGKTGMGVSGGFSFREISNAELQATVADTSLEALRSNVTSSQFGVIKSGVSSLGLNPNDSVLNLFNRKAGAGTGKGGNFQISVATVDDDGNLTIEMGFYEYKTANAVDDVLFYKVAQGQVAFRGGNTVLTLGKTTADSARASMRQRLEGKVNDNIAHILI